MKSKQYGTVATDMAVTVLFAQTRGAGMFMLMRANFRLTFTGATA
jgi:hypothetical protein